MWTNVFNDFIWLPFFVAYFIIRDLAAARRAPGRARC
jgi:hypothetical protein